MSNPRRKAPQVSSSIGAASEAEHGPSRGAFFALIAAVLWGWVFAAVFFQLELPNSVPRTSRSDLWLDLPDLLYYCVVQHPEAAPSGWKFLPQRFPSIACGLWIIVAAWACGHLVLRVLRLHDHPVWTGGVEPYESTPRWTWCFERSAIAYALGISTVSLLVLLTGLTAQWVPGLLSRAVIGGIFTTLIVSEITLRVRQARSISAGHAVSGVQPEANQQARPGRQRSRRNQPAAGPSWIEIALRGQIPFSVMARSAATIAIVLFITAMALGSLLPSIDFDVKEYHLQGPKEYLQNGCISFLPHNVYTSFPFLTEMISLAGMVLAGDWFIGALAGKLALMSFAPATALAVASIARRWFGNKVAWAVALIHLTTPWTYRISVIAYAEGGLTLFVAATLLAALLTVTSSSRRNDVTAHRRMLLLCGLLAGSGMACKYPGVVSVVIPIGLFLVWHAWKAPATGLDHDAPIGNSDRARSVMRTSVIYSLGCLITIGPWLMKNFFETGNPVYPLLNSVFHGIDWTPTLEANWKGGHSPPHHDLSDIPVKMFDVTFKSDWLSPLLFGFAPLAWLPVLLRNARPTEAANGSAHSSATGSTTWLIASLWLYVVWLFATWWLLTHRIDRFWIPLIPVVAILAGVGAWWSETRLWRYLAGAFVALSVLFNLGFITTHHCGLNAWLGDLESVRRIASGTAPPIAFLNGMRLRDKPRVLCVGEAQVFDAEFDVIYNTVFDISIFETICSANRPEISPADQSLKPPGEILAELHARDITYVLVNWQEVLRYRTTYGYTDFVAPNRFASLMADGILDRNWLRAANPRAITSFSDSEQQMIRTWGPELLLETTDGTFVEMAVVYRVN